MYKPGLTKCNIVERDDGFHFEFFILFDLATSLSKFRIRRKNPLDFSQTNLGKINSLGSYFVSTITGLAYNKVFISAVINSCSFLLMGTDTNSLLEGCQLFQYMHSFKT